LDGKNETEMERGRDKTRPRTGGKGPWIKKTCQGDKCARCWDGFPCYGCWSFRGPHGSVEVDIRPGGARVVQARTCLRSG
jgi:hypothetical protein